MSAAAPSEPQMIIPESAPFSPEQRAWLSGFFAASIAALAEAGPPANDAGPGGGTGLPAGPVLASNDDAPWHDPAMVADERMELAKEKPLAPRLMAAMAQQDCGQCGYNCADYANAIFNKAEERLNLCAPGGKVTARLLKGLAVELNDTNGPREGVESGTDGAKSPALEAREAPLIGLSREAPAEAVFHSRRKLNADGSEKDTWHIEFDISNSGVQYKVGDSFGVFPRNNQGLVDQIIAMLGAVHTLPVRGRTLRDVLRDDVSIGIAPDSLFELFSYISGGQTREKARALARGEDPDGDAAQLDVLAVLHKFSTVRPHPEAFVDALEPLQPRLYSISSSPKARDGGLSLTVDAVRYLINKRKRTGVASTFLADSIEPGERLRVYVQKAHGFQLPEDPAKPVIMVGPGTGVAPFRAFLQERQHSGAPGKNWLFFGHQRQATDYFYREEFEALHEAGVLTRLSLAWSRDAGQKVYVQDRMREVGADLWQWLEEGAHVYVCGDAKRMAKDVETTLVEIVTRHGHVGTDEAIGVVTKLKTDGRFQLDVY